jgi:choloylglycine hydrolase
MRTIPASPRNERREQHGNVLADYTIWTSASYLKAKRYYFRTYENSQIRMLDLMKMNIDGMDIVKSSMKGGEIVKPLVPELRQLSGLPNAALSA